MVSKETRKEMEEALGRVPSFFEELPPQTADQFWWLMRDFELAETEIPGKYKELIGLAVSGATRCRYCTLFHTENAKLHGATPEEIAEANAMAGLTMGLSTFINGQQVDYDRFRKETEAIVAHVRTQAEAQAATA